jgi:LPXTG-motif cell wall-anchored protein
LAIAVSGGELSSAAAPQSLWVTASTGEAAEPQAGGGTEDRLVLAMPSMGVAQSQRITVTVGLGEEAPNAMQQQAAPVRFEIRMTESVPQAAPSGPDTPGHRPSFQGPRAASLLADTGLTGMWVAALGASLVAGGWLAVIRSRRKKNANEGMSNGTA